MIIKNKLVFISFFIFFSHIYLHGLINWKGKIDINDKTVELAGNKLHEAIPKLGEEAQKLIPAVGKEFKELLPELEKSLTKSSKDIVKALRTLISPVKVLPVIGVGFVGSIAGIMIIKRGIEKYFESLEDDKKREAAKKLIAAGIAGLCLGGAVMVKSDSIVNFFCG
jgi:hypothetical protein